MKVAGVSMSPTISHGDYVIVDMRGKPKDLDVVIIDISSISGLENDLFIKRYYEDYSTDGLYIIGDNVSNSYDSRLIGEVPKECLKGVVVFNLSKWLESVGIR